MTDERNAERSAGSGTVSRRTAVPLGAALVMALARAGSAGAQDATPAADADSAGWVVIRRYHLLPDTTHDDVISIVNAEFVPLMQGVPGFIQYLLIEASEREQLTFTVFTDEAGANEATEISKVWAPEAVGHLVEMPAFEVISGPIGLEAAATSTAT